MSHLEAVADSINIPFATIKSSKYDNLFRPISEVIDYQAKWPGALWVRFTIKNATPKTHEVVIENYNNKLQDYIFYNPITNFEYEIKSFGTNMPFYTRDYQQRAYQVNSVLLPYEVKTYYFRYAHFMTEPPVIILSSDIFFFNYTYNVHFLLGIFYGALLFTVLINGLNFLILKDKSYLFYFLFILCQFLYHFDGFGFKYFWYDMPWVNKYYETVLFNLIIIFGTLSSITFMNINKSGPGYYKILIGFICYKVVYMILACIFPILSHNKYYAFDGIFMSLPIIFGIFFQKNKSSDVVFYLLAFATYIFFNLLSNTVQYWFTVNILDSVIGLDNSHFLYRHILAYGDEFGVLIQIILVAIAFIKKYQNTNSEKIAGQNDIILQLNENQKLKDELNLNLSKLMDERGHELEYKNKQLEDFTYKVSHDLKSPVNSMIGLANIAIDENTDDNTKQYLLQIQKSAVRMKNMVNELLKVLKEEKSFVLNIEPIDWTTMLNDVLSGLSHIKEYKKVKINIITKIETSYSTDKVLMESILQNLIENSIKYRNKQAQQCYIDIEIIINDQMKVIVVKDNGIGISDEAQPYVFDIFYRGVTEAKGSGLGLYLVKSNVEKLGGKIILTSEKGIGTTVKIYLR
ncbi:MAG: sensor histidine kinase [Cytophagales bacterium]|nr:sensor histidine kinase [Cytophagales bacterium]